jgi:hypothetical protein
MSKNISRACSKVTGIYYQLFFIFGRVLTKVGDWTCTVFDRVSVFALDVCSTRPAESLLDCVSVFSHKFVSSLKSYLHDNFVFKEKNIPCKLKTQKLKNWHTTHPLRTHKLTPRLNP